MRDVLRTDRPGRRRAEAPPPHDERRSQGRSDSGVRVGLLPPPRAELRGHPGVVAHAGAYGQGDHQRLDRVNDGQGRQACIRIAPHEEAVHDAIERLDQLRQHDRGASLKRILPIFSVPKKNPTCPWFLSFRPQDRRLLRLL